ncbi:MAG: hypothetical protein WAK75_05820 [Methanoregula sp.]|uniref:hypothetical protein n=1 Tax=Methanoregula sp. TaxID=2052170 RepID=UPI003BAF6B33
MPVSRETIIRSGNLPGHLAGTRDTCTPDGIFLTPITPTTLLEYSGAGLGILGWLGVREVGSAGAQEIGFIVWIASGLILIAWGYHTKAKAIMVINAVNVIMAASALAALI